MDKTDKIHLVHFTANLIFALRQQKLALELGYGVKAAQQILILFV